MQNIPIVLPEWLIGTIFEEIFHTDSSQETTPSTSSNSPDYEVIDDLSLLEKKILLSLKIAGKELTDFIEEHSKLETKHDLNNPDCIHLKNLEIKFLCFYFMFWASVRKRHSNLYALAFTNDFKLASKIFNLNEVMKSDIESAYHPAFTKSVGMLPACIALLFKKST